MPTMNPDALANEFALLMPEQEYKTVQEQNTMDGVTDTAAIAAHFHVTVSDAAACSGARACPVSPERNNDAQSNYCPNCTQTVRRAAPLTYLSSYPINDYPCLHTYHDIKGRRFRINIRKTCGLIFYDALRNCSSRLCL